MESETNSMAESGSAIKPTWTAPTWEEIVHDYSDQVYRLAYRLTGNRPDAEDLSQDVFVKVFRSINTFKPGTLSGWLHRITVNLFIDSTRRRQRIQLDGQNNMPEHVWGKTDGPNVLHDQTELDHDVSAALAQLKPELRVAVVLCDIEGLKYDEIAKIFDLRLATVKSRIYRGRMQLRKSLAHRQPTGDRERYFGVSG